MKYNAGCCNYAGFVSSCRNVYICDWVFVIWFTFHWRVIYFSCDLRYIIPANTFDWSNKEWPVGRPQGVLDFQTYFIRILYFIQLHFSRTRIWYVWPAPLRDTSVTPLFKPVCYVQTTVTTQNYACFEINSRLNSVNICYYSIQNTISFLFIYTKLKTAIYKIQILPVVLFLNVKFRLTSEVQYGLKLGLCENTFLRGIFITLFIKGLKFIFWIRDEVSNILNRIYRSRWLAFIYVFFSYFFWKKSYEICIETTVDTTNLNTF
jgi:hypothetical protein